MILKDVLKKIEELYPLDLQEDWDNSGLQVGDYQQPVARVLLALDITEEVVQVALEQEVDLVLAHHPLFFRGTKQIERSSRLGRILYPAMVQGLALYAAHTNLDQAPGGVGQVLGQRIGLDRPKVLVENSDFPGWGYGAWGQVASQPARTYLEQVKEALDLDFLLAYGDLNRTIEKVGILGGAGASFIGQAQALGLDLYLTADLKYHEAMEAQEQGLLLADLGHFESEAPVLEAWARALGQALPQLDLRVYRQDIRRQVV